MWDARSREVRLLPDIAGPGQYAFADGGRKLIINREPAESDVWMLTLE